MRHLRRTSRLLALAGAWVGALACGEPRSREPEAGEPRELPHFVLADEAALELGVADGDAHFLFERIVSVRWLESGQIAVADAGAGRISLFAPSGAWVREWGGRGDGPGEFRSLARIYPIAVDSVLALDTRRARFSVFDTLGRYARGGSASDLSGDPYFALDVWLHRRFIVEGAFGKEDRAAARGVLDGLPRPGPTVGYRFVRVMPSGELWIREPPDDGASLVRWTIVSPSGALRATLDAPARFEPYDGDLGRILGRWRGAADLNFVRVQRALQAGSAPLPDWLAGPGGAPPLAAPTGAARAEMASALTEIAKQMATQQEIYYSNHFHYAPQLDSLELQADEDVELYLVAVEEGGWALAAAQAASDQLCLLAYGSATPPGLAAGVVKCGS